MSYVSNAERYALHPQLGRNDDNLLRSIIRLRLNTLQLIGAKRKSRPAGLRGASFIVPEVLLLKKRYHNIFKASKTYQIYQICNQKAVSDQLELAHESKQVLFVCYPLLITRFVVFHIHFWDTTYFLMVGFMLYCSKHRC
jgi:hypothetical protein